ncbi:MAG TPA: SDR family oxidoreductase [Chthoniobacteraceae bacterium]|jgi:NAD(P)-dependent dehydrogenase (short-subunit alcohol dehydrogenase family)|nr:SDR family oxidoreductase [Chthoniobacteraceae bacterium]
MSKTCVITGAGSGVGQALALQLAEESWRVAIVGRRPEALEETGRRAGARAKQFFVCPCDIGDSSAVADMSRRVLAEFGDVEVLVNAAGTNVPRRALAELSLGDYRAMIDTNLNGAYYCVQSFLPQMRARGGGTIVNIVSDAGKLASPKAGPGYVMSKFGLAGLTQSINAEERGHGIRACAIFPGDIDTPLLNQRPQPPDAAARAKMMQPEDVAACAMLCLRLPAHVIVEELLVRPR